MSTLSNDSKFVYCVSICYCFQNTVSGFLNGINVCKRRAIRENNVKAFTMFDIDRYGIGKVMEMAMDHLAGKKARPIHMSYDIDAVDPSVAPSTGTAVPGGLSYREGHFVAEFAAHTGLLGSMELVEVNPSIGSTPNSDEPTRTVKFAKELLDSALGRAIM